MIKTLKSELKLRPTYDEMIGMIESQGNPNRPSIEKVIDRRATLFRNNQFGSQFDNVDFLGLKKQEEDKVKNELRQAQLRQTAISTGSSMGVISATSSGFNTPLEIELLDGQELSADEIARIQADLEDYNQRMQQARDRAISSVSSDLDDVHRQTLPVGVPVHSMESDGSETMPDLVPIEGDDAVASSGRSRDEEEELEDDEEVEDDDETQVPPQSRKHKEMIDYNNKIERWRQKDVNFDDILFQMHLRGINLTNEQQEEMDKLKIKGKGKSETKKDYLLRVVEGLIDSGRWTDHVNDQLLQSRMKEWREMKKGKGKGGGIGSAIASGAKAVGGAVLDAGKEVAKDVALAVAQNAVASLL